MGKLWVEIQRAVLCRIVGFNQVFPNVATWQHLTWSHYRELLTLEDAATRQGLLVCGTDLCRNRHGKIRR